MSYRYGEPGPFDLFSTPQGFLLLALFCDLYRPTPPAPVDWSEIESW
jgi:hypothetical protein